MPLWSLLLIKISFDQIRLNIFLQQFLSVESFLKADLRNKNMHIKRHGVIVFPFNSVLRISFDLFCIK